MTPVNLISTLGIALLLGLGCSVIAPPPVLAPHDLSYPLAESTTMIGIAGGLGGSLGLDAEDGYGLELRVTHQLGSQTQLSAGVGFAVNSTSIARNEDGRNVGRKGPKLMSALRLALQYNPDPDNQWIALVGGIGGGLGTGGLRYLTLDAGTRLSTQVSRGGVYFAPHIALSLPMGGQHSIDGTRVTPTYFLSANLGLVSRTYQNGSVSLDLQATRGKAFAHDDNVDYNGKVLPGDESILVIGSVGTQHRLK